MGLESGTDAAFGYHPNHPPWKRILTGLVIGIKLGNTRIVSVTTQLQILQLEMGLLKIWSRPWTFVIKRRNRGANKGHLKPGTTRKHGAIPSKHKQANKSSSKSCKGEANNSNVQMVESTSLIDSNSYGQLRMIFFAVKSAHGEQ